MSIAEWNARYRAGEQLFETPSQLVTRFTAALPPGRALDLACGAGRHSLYLAKLGWNVTAVDGSPYAIEILANRAQSENLKVDARVEDLEQASFEIALETYDLILDCYYLQRDLFQRMRDGLRRGGLLLSIVHLADPDQPPGSAHRAVAGELRAFFPGWTILHDYEGVPTEQFHKSWVSELVARKP